MSYTARITIAVPTELMAQANQLALLIGESPADVHTFTTARYTKDGIDYALSSTACVPRVVDLLSADAIEVKDDDDPESVGISNRHDADLLAAGAAFQAIQQGLILVSTNVDPSAAIEELGIESIQNTEEA